MAAESAKRSIGLKRIYIIHLFVLILGSKNCNTTQIYESIYCFVHQHGRLFTRVKTKNKEAQPTSLLRDAEPGTRPNLDPRVSLLPFHRWKASTATHRYTFFLTWFHLIWIILESISFLATRYTRDNVKLLLSLEPLYGHAITYLPFPAISVYQPTCVESLPVLLWFPP